MVLETHLYNVLSALPNASCEEISKCYKKVALRCHPDKTNHDPQLTEKFKEVTRAYEILKDEKTRQVYDNYGEAGLDGTCVTKSQSNRPKKYNSSCNLRTATNIFANVFNDINSMFNRDLFGGGFDSFPQFPMNMNMNMNMDNIHMGGSSQGNLKKHVLPAPNDNTNKLIRGHDINHTCNVLLEDFYSGKVVKFQLPKNSKCIKCIGLGGMNPKSCGTCQGSGMVFLTLFNEFSQFQELRLCKPCNGTGIYISQKDRCLECNRGYVKEKKIIKVNILPGFKSGDKIVLQGEGDEGRNVIPGDVIIHLQETPHPKITRKGDDLFMDHDLDLKTALLGGSIILNDFLKRGQNLKININVHGNQDLNSAMDKNIQYGEVVGTINSETPKIVKGCGMPIYGLDSDGVHYQSSSDIEDVSVLFDIEKYMRGNLFVRFNIKLPSISDFKNKSDLRTLLDILPSTESQFSRGIGSGNIVESHLSNLPDFMDRSNVSEVPLGQAQRSHSGISSDSTERHNEQKNKKFKSANYNYAADDSGYSEYDYDDINIDDDKIDGNESDEEKFYAEKWTKDETGKGKKRRHDSGISGSNNFQDPAIHC